MVSGRAKVFLKKPSKNWTFHYTAWPIWPSCHQQVTSRESRDLFWLLLSLKYLTQCVEHCGYSKNICRVSSFDWFLLLISKRLKIDVPVIYCQVTNHPKIEWHKPQLLFVCDSSLWAGSVDVFVHLCSTVGQMGAWLRSGRPSKTASCPPGPLSA